MIRRFISNIITEDDISSWTSSRPVIIQASTGCGKTYFIRNKLCEHARRHNRKILLLSHRVKCVEQNRLYISQDNNSDIIDCKTYQSIEYDILHGKPVNLDKYAYIVADEFHYFLTDSVFNHNTDVSLDAIMHCDCVKIMMSATCDNIVDYISMNYKSEFITYNSFRNYENIRLMYFYQMRDYAQLICSSAISDNKKVVIFTQNIDDAVDIYNAYKSHAMFCCASGRSEYRYVDEERVNRMLREKTFDCNILVTTSVMSTGIDLIDRDITDIIIDLTDVDEIVQAIGRKRVIDDDDKFVLHVKCVQLPQIKKYINRCKRVLDIGNDYLTMTEDEFRLKHPREFDSLGVVYDRQSICDGKAKAINPVVYSKYQRMTHVYEDMQKLGDAGFCFYIADMLSDTKYDFICSRYSFYDYLKTHVNLQMMTQEERDELAYMIDIKKRGVVATDIKTMNYALEHLYRCDYRVVRRRCKKGEFRDKYYWMIVNTAE